MSNLGFRIIQDINRPSKELLEAFRGVPTAFIGDAVNRFLPVLTQKDQAGQQGQLEDGRKRLHCPNEDC